MTRSFFDTNVLLCMYDNAPEKKVTALEALVEEAGAEEIRWGLEQGLPLKDAPVLGAAVRSGVDYLVTVDARHFGRLFDRVVGEVRVVTPATALAILFKA